MTMQLRIDSLEIDDHILDKIEQKHHVELREVEEIVVSTENHVRKDREGFYKVFGQTLAGRYLLAVLVHKDKGRWKVVTARSMSETEKANYKQLRK